MGTACARSLGERGLETVLFEQFAIGHASGSSHGPTRIFRLAYPQPDYVRLARRALEAWRELEDAAGEELLVKTGGLYAGAWAEECGQALTACGVPREWLPAAEAAERFPGDRLRRESSASSTRRTAPCAWPTARSRPRPARSGGGGRREGAVRGDPHRRRRRPASAWTRGGHRVGAGGAWWLPARGRAGFSRSLPSSCRCGPPSRRSATSRPGRAPRRSRCRRSSSRISSGGGLGSGGYWIPPGRRGERAEGRRRHARPHRRSRVRARARWTRPGGARRRRGSSRRAPGSFRSRPARETCVYTMTPDEDFVIERVGRDRHRLGLQRARLQVRAARSASVLADLVTGADPGLPEARFSARRAALVAG